MKKSDSGAWQARNRQDPYVHARDKQGYRARSAFKLLEIQEKYSLVRDNMRVVELGAAPGGWSQVVMRSAKNISHIAIDKLPMAPITGVRVITGDFTEFATLEKINEQLQGFKLDLVISDMAPNLSGIGSIDQPRAIYLVELGLDFAVNTLNIGGTFLVKVFQGEGFNDLLALMRRSFKKVKIIKPKASRTNSREVYLLATGFVTG